MGRLGYLIARPQIAACDDVEWKLNLRGCHFPILSFAVENFSTECLQGDSNPQPAELEAAALPLSYGD